MPDWKAKTPTNWYDRRDRAYWLTRESRHSFRVTDSQRKKAYRSEGVLRYLEQRHYESHAHARRHVLDIISTDFVQKRMLTPGEYGCENVKQDWRTQWSRRFVLEAKRSRSGAYARGLWLLRFRPGSIPEWLLLHELAHTLSNHHEDRMNKVLHLKRGLREHEEIHPEHVGYFNAGAVGTRRMPTTAGHGPLWCNWYLDLVRLRMGRKAHDILKESFKGNGVRTRSYPVGPKRANPCTLPGHVKVQVAARNRD